MFRESGGLLLVVLDVGAELATVSAAGSLLMPPLGEKLPFSLFSAV